MTAAVIEAPPAARPAAAPARARPTLAAAGAYLALSLVAWWHLLGAASGLPAGSADPAQEAWFLAWVPHALGSGTDPFVTHAVLAPGGVNLLSNTSILLLGLLLAPVTVTAGPLAALAVGTVLAPAASALGGYVLARRVVRWQPAAFAAGLCYGFGPFCATDLRYAHLDLTWLALPPLVFACLDALVLRPTQPTRPSRATGATLGALLVAQFFISTELLAITVLTAGAGLALAAAARPGLVVARARAAAPALGIAAAIAAVALAYPMWMVVAGPRHTSGPVWASAGQIASTLASTVQPHAEVGGVAFISGGNGSYLGVGLLAVLVAGTIWCWRRAPLVRLPAALALVCFVASLGYDLHAGTASLHVPLPAAVLGHLPLVDSIVPERFMAMVDLLCALVLAVVLDALRGAAGVALPLGAAALALVPLAAVPAWPYPVRTLHRPPVLATLTGRLAVYPDASGAAADEMVWQAQDGYRFTLADGYAIVPGRGGRAVESPPSDALWLVFAAASLGRLRLPLTPTTVRSMRAALRHDGIARVVVLPGAAGSGAALGAMRQVLGRPVTAATGAAVWP